MNKHWKEDMHVSDCLIQNVPFLLCDDYECRTLKTELTLAKIYQHMKKYYLVVFDYDDWNDEFE